MGMLTCNALIVLLDCYRGFGHYDDLHLGTLNSDLAFLRRLNFIAENNKLTPSGFNFCKTKFEVSNLDCDELILLADCYRGCDYTRHGLDFENNIFTLIDANLVDRWDPNHRPTDKGRKIVEVAMGKDMKDEGGERLTYKEGAGQKESDYGRGHDELISPIFEERLAIWLEKGARKYESRNWEKGIPFGRIFRALKRHTRQYIEGQRDEDHLAAIACNIMFLMHYETMIERGLMDPRIMDLPNYFIDANLQNAAREAAIAKWDSKQSDEEPF